MNPESGKRLCGSPGRPPESDYRNDVSADAVVQLKVFLTRDEIRAFFAVFLN